MALPSQGQLFPDSGRATVSGWGTLRSGGALPDLLHAVEVPLVSDASCEDSYGNRMSAKEMLCAGEEGKDSCQGDSGGPLICKVRKKLVPHFSTGIGDRMIAYKPFALDFFQDGDVQCGVVSWGIGCADAGYPGVYSEVANYIDWISNNA